MTFLENILVWGRSRMYRYYRPPNGCYQIRMGGLWPCRDLSLPHLVIHHPYQNWVLFAQHQPIPVELIQYMQSRHRGTVIIVSGLSDDIRRLPFTIISYNGDFHDIPENVTNIVSHRGRINLRSIHGTLIISALALIPTIADLVNLPEVVVDNPAQDLSRIDQNQYLIEHAEIVQEYLQQHVHVIGPTIESDGVLVFMLLRKNSKAD